MYHYMVERLKEVECNLNGYASQAFFDAVVNYKVLSHADPSTVSAARLGELLAYNYLVDEEKYQNSLEQKAERIDAIQERMRNREKETYEEIEKCLTSSKNEIENFQSSFREHLRLEAPAQYWEKSSQKYQKSARLWGGVLFLLICIGLIGFFYLYSRFLIGQNLALRLDTVKGVVLFFTGITIYGFQIRVISKLLISSLHLQRDSEERAKLTYFYLSLIKDGAIDEDSRNIIIQSLFSRTDTGLLSGDSSPTMPYIDALKNIKVSS
ncbi:DUF6161 domain-containing protein [Photobacterium damselae]|uniref:DUF6161 domain-containing protein n=1 Tax=Photobacterium damselae TaxID=38293 RepID=UPI001F297AB3|nr:DUF6161 domain-containing protein [Photobacterium damselae]UKA11695.1 DUF6161 domain-containing protein [Photobacterium damselae subsp. damselae]